MYNVILDVDGTLLMWRDVFVSWLQKHNFEVNNISPADYGLSNIKFEGKLISKNFRNELSLLFNESYYLKKLPPLDGAMSAIKTLRDMGCRLTVISSYTDNFEAMKAREENLINVFGDVFENIVSLPLHASKREWLDQQDKESIFVEDSISHIIDALSVGFDVHNCFLIPHAHNYDKWLLNTYNGQRINRMYWHEIIRNIRV